MTKATHTSGPWANNDGLIMGARDASGYQQTVASIYGPDGEQWDAETSTRQNASLIAAAPDMLAALENALPWLIKADIDGAFNGCALPLGGRKAWEQIERAIAKAKGQG